MKTLLTLSAALTLTVLSGCANQKAVVTPTPQAPILPSPVIQLSERATPTTGSTATTKAHYEHVFLDGNGKDRRSLKTIELNDATLQVVGRGIAVTGQAPSAKTTSHLTAAALASLNKPPTHQARTSQGPVPHQLNYSEHEDDADDITVELQDDALQVVGRGIPPRKATLKRFW